VLFYTETDVDVYILHTACEILCHYKRGNGNGEKVTSRAFQELRHKNKIKNKKERKQNNNTNRHEEL
jgi:hypothetical protein